MITAIEQFRQAMSSAGIEPPGEIVADGALHRFTVPGDKAGKKNGWYVLHGDDPAAGVFGCWKRQINETWSSKPHQTMTPADKVAHAARMEAVNLARKAEIGRKHEECRVWCVSTWGKAEDATSENPYLKSKGVNSYGLKSFKDSLLVPVQDLAGTIHGLQFIAPDGSKKFKTGTNKTGHYAKIGRSKDKTVIVCEGYATGASIHQATGHAVVIAFDAGNLSPVAQGIRSKCPDFKIIIAADDDHATEGNPGLTKATEAARAVVGLLAVPVFPVDRGPKDTDFNDLHQLAGLDAVRLQIEEAEPTLEEPPFPTYDDFQERTDNNEPGKKAPRLKAVTIEELLLNEFPKRESLLHPILHTQSLNMVHAWRGCGKTHFGLGVAYATSSAGRFLKWKAETPRPVLYIDGEMPGNSLQDRLAAIVAANEEEPPPGFFRVLTPDLQEPGTMPDLSTADGQAAIDALVADDTALIVVDNLSCLCRGGKENESESWIPIQGWALRHRAAGRSILFVHHSGKGGEQRGTSKREDVLDLVLKLKRPADYEPSQGACFEVIFEKARHLAGDETTSFEATLTRDESGKQLWVFRDVTETTYERVIELISVGLNQNEVAHELDIHKSTVSRHVKKAQAENKLPKAEEKRAETTGKK